MNENINYELKKIEDIAIFKLNEKRFDTSIAGFVKGEFTILLHTGDIHKLIIDLSEVEYCDSSGLSAILLAYRILQANDGILRLAAPTKNVKTLIQISQLDRVLYIHNTVDEALQELRKD
ncbi:sulfate transporter/antisigma-factor antagonist stas [Melioribacter roseus P3M-2]|jgi:anti-anti-sigma factor|uniref:Sulfate transporter/antisigma-factor antagonist stas n=1 Tax=Melioribacter roseus (strain DSM 23840 / JCM 17771 / VKM B-2668 / P3M-2) TaxID=1191523 RepID=I7A1A1_MELRP|nr:STAS domain-containing protein [Melioribacter roseus]AFN74978.1 sulfate transporter/antisigma-factor antagonist stas [Melioribacter roseus P3M-2]